MQKTLIKAILSICIINSFIYQPAYAYLDPGTGSMIVQIIIASIVGIGCTLKLWKDKVISIFRHWKKDDKKN